MPALITNAEIASLSDQLLLGQIWGDATAGQREMAVDTAEAVWRTLNWRSDPFADPTTALELRQPLLLHARLILELEGDVRDATMPPAVAALLQRYLRARPRSLHPGLGGAAATDGATPGAGAPAPTPTRFQILSALGLTEASFGRLIVGIGRTSNTLRILGADGSIRRLSLPTPLPRARNTSVDTSEFDGNLTDDDNTVQRALETLDDLMVSGEIFVLDALPADLTPYNNDALIVVTGATGRGLYAVSVEEADSYEFTVTPISSAGRFGYPLAGTIDQDDPNFVRGVYWESADSMWYLAIDRQDFTYRGPITLVWDGIAYRLSYIQNREESNDQLDYSLWDSDSVISPNPVTIGTQVNVSLRATDAFSARSTTMILGGGTGGGAALSTHEADPDAHHPPPTVQSLFGDVSGLSSIGSSDVAAGDHFLIHDDDELKRMAAPQLANYIGDQYGAQTESEVNTLIAAHAQTRTDAEVEELARDAVGAALRAGAGITITPDDAADTITVAATGSARTDDQVQELARDAVGAALTAGSGIRITPDDAANTITIDATGEGEAGHTEAEIAALSLAETIRALYGVDGITVSVEGSGASRRIRLRLSQRGVDLLSDLTGGGWNTVPGAIAQIRSATPLTASQLTGATYVATYQPGDVIDDQNYGLRVPKGTVLNSMRELRIADSDGTAIFDRIVITSLTMVTTDASWDYYGLAIHRIPVGKNLLLALYDPIHIQNALMRWSQILDTPDYMLWPVSLAALPALPWRRGLRFFQDSGGTLAYGPPKEYAWSDEATAYVVVIGDDDPSVSQVVAFKSNAPIPPGVSGAVAGKVFYRIPSGGSSNTWPSDLECNQEDYNTITPRGASGGDNFHEVVGLTTDTFIATIAGHPAGTVLLRWQRADGTFLTDSQNCPEGDVTYEFEDDVGVWRETVVAPAAAPSGGGGGANILSQVITTGEANLVYTESGLSLTITPSAAGRKIYALVSGGRVRITSATRLNSFIRIQAGGTNIAEHAISTDMYDGPISVSAIHTAANTSPVTIAVQWRESNGVEIQATSFRPMTLLVMETD